MVILIVGWVMAFPGPLFLCFFERWNNNYDRPSLNSWRTDLFVYAWCVCMTLYLIHINCRPYSTSSYGDQFAVCLACSCPLIPLSAFVGEWCIDYGGVNTTWQYIDLYTPSLVPRPFCQNGLGTRLVHPRNIL